MILEQKQTNVLVTGEDSSKKATINQDKIAKLQYLLTKGLYSDPISATIVELTNNAVDAVVASGKDPIEHPVIVSITDSLLSIEDKGIGLNKEEFENVVMNYLTSTKEDDNQAIGYFGIGSKSFLSLERSATFICRKNGIEYKFLCYQGEEFLEYDLVYEKQTQEENGVRVEIKINGYYEKRDFINKALKKLSYYDTVLLYIGEELNVNKIIRNKHWQHSSNCNTSSMHFCLKDVYYEIDWNKLGLNRIDIPIALRFDLDSGITPTPSRESILYTSETIELLKRKIETVANWFIDKYNSEWKEYETFKDAWHFRNQYNFYVDINNTKFKINDLEEYADNKIKRIKVKNVKDIGWYYDNKQWLLTNYSVLVEKTSWKWVKKDFSKNIVEKLMNNYKVVVINSKPERKVKSYLDQKYSNTLFIQKICDRKLGKDDQENKTTYFYTLDLDNVPQHEWKNKIKELNYVENSLKENFIYELDIENSQGFKDWSEKKKKERVYEKTTSKSNHKVLNKQEDEVTLGIGRKRSIGQGVTFEKETFKIKELFKTPKLSIYFENKERAAQYFDLIGRKYRILLVGKREALKIKNIHNFMTEQEFQKSKVFKRIVTSIMFDELVQTYKEIYNRESLNIIQELLKPLQADIEILELYTANNGKTIRDNELLNSMKAIAKEYNLYDYQFMDVYNRCKESLDKYKFLNYIQKPDRWNEENVKEVNSIITQFLYHQKMYRGLHQELEFVVKEEEKQVLEELQLEIV
jgi:hypothetical protein